MWNGAKRRLPTATSSGINMTRVLVRGNPPLLVRLIRISGSARSVSILLLKKVAQKLVKRLCLIFVPEMVLFIINPAVSLSVQTERFAAMENA